MRLFNPLKEFYSNLEWEKKIYKLKYIKRFVFIVIVLNYSLLKVYADRQTPAEVLKDAMLAMQAEQFDDAAILMYLYLGQVEESKAERVVQIAQDIRFKLSTVLIQLDRLDEAAFLLEEYYKTPYAKNARQALKMMATCFYEINDYESTVDAVTNALAYVSPKFDNLDQFDEVKILDDEPNYTKIEKVALNLIYAESNLELKRWKDAVVGFEFVIANTKNSQRKGYAIMQLVNALIELESFERITEWIPQLYRTDARFDIRVNLALLNAASALYAAERYDSALPLYRMIIPKNELIQFQEKKLKTLRIEAGLPPDLGAEMTEDERLLFGVVNDNEVESQIKDNSSGLLVNKPKELIEHEELLVALREMNSYEIDVDYRMADLYRVVNRYWESISFFEQVYLADPKSDIGERSLYELVDLLLNSLNEVSLAEKYAFKFMHENRNGISPRQMAYLLNEFYQSAGNMESVKGLKVYLENFERTNIPVIIQYDAELYFMQAVADLMLLNYTDAESGFKFILENFPDSHQAANSLYWHAMARLFLQNYDDALNDFLSYINRYSSESYIDECEFQVGVCLFGLEQYDEALESFSRVISIYKDSSVYPEACSMRGDIYGSRGLLDEAVQDYNRAIEAAKNISQATYPTFQMAEIYEAENQYERIVSCVQSYLDSWGEKADIAKATYWIGKTQIQQKLITEAIDTYIGVVREYGDDVLEQGVDLIIDELIKISKVYLNHDEQSDLKKKLKEAILISENETLSLRLKVALANIEGENLQLGAQLIRELETLDHASPPVLSCICDASFVKKDFSRAEEILNLFTLYYNESDFMRSAFKLRAYGQLEEEDYNGVLDTIEEAQENYGTEFDVSWTQLLKADVLLKMNRYEEAYSANLGVLNVRAWRGEAYAQATYQLGQVEEARNEILKAFGFYQRTYFQYKGHAGGKWAADAYLASARCLDILGLENDKRNTFRAMLFDPFVNTLEQANVAREILGQTEVDEIERYIELGVKTNITVEIKIDMVGAEL